MPAGIAVFGECFRRVGFPGDRCGVYGHIRISWSGQARSLLEKGNQ
jgi:hypothetical protein